MSKKEQSLNPKTMKENEIKLRATLEMVCNILNNCEWTLDGAQDPEYLLTGERFIHAVVEKYHTNKR